jgi:hypothetical protein
VHGLVLKLNHLPLGCVHGLVWQLNHLPSGGEHDLVWQFIHFHLVVFSTWLGFVS